MVGGLCGQKSSNLHLTEMRFVYKAHETND
jgi:hypothetical protein